MTTTPDLYELLDVSPFADCQALKIAHRKLIKIYHPDINPAGIETFHKINDAYFILKDPVRRRMYNEYRSDPRCGYDMNGIIMASVPDDEEIINEVNYSYDFKIRNEDDITNNEDDITNNEGGSVNCNPM